jgi:hypothetical protein
LSPYKAISESRLTELPAFMINLVHFDPAALVKLTVCVPVPLKYIIPFTANPYPVKVSTPAVCVRFPARYIIEEKAPPVV